MGELARFCPQCGAPTLIRLGENQCTKCSFSQPAGAGDADLRGPGSGSTAGRQPGSGPGLPGSAKVHSAGQLPGMTTKQPLQGQPVVVESVSWQAPPPQAAPQQSTSQYMPGGVAPADMYSFLPGERRSGSAGLEIEKKIFFGLQAVSMLIIFFAFLLGGQMFMTEAGLYTVSMLTLGVIIVITFALILGLYYWVLFGSEVWAKWTCMGCVGLSAVSALSGIFFAAGVSTLPGAGGNAFTGIINLLITGWFISILWRDVQEIQGN
jgi:hypothetical protein